MKKIKKYSWVILFLSLVTVLVFSGCLQQNQPNEEQTPCVVRNVNATDQIPGVATITWDLKCPILNNSNGSEIEFYKIYRNGEHLINSEDNQHIDYDVIIGEEYTYRVSAVSTTGNEGPKSDPSEVKIKEGMPGV